MKWLIILLFPSLCFAKEYHFHYRLDYHGKVNTLEYKTNAPDYATALERGAMVCARFFVDLMPTADLFSEDSKWEIFNTCENPREN